MVHNLDPESVNKMIQLDLADLDDEPPSTIGEFSFHGSTDGVTAFKAVRLGSFTARRGTPFHSGRALRVDGTGERQTFRTDPLTWPACDRSAGVLAFQQRAGWGDHAVDHSQRRK
jgi:hypothetical protein